MRPFLKQILPKRTLIALALALTLFFTGRKLNEYTAEPTQAKDCPPWFPSPADPEKSYQLDLQTLPDLSWWQKGGTINDASCLNRTPIYGIVQVKRVEDIQTALQFAKAHQLKISLSAVRHSMGGQAFFNNALVLDMMDFKQMSLDETHKILTVQSGATWHDIQNFLHPRYAVKAMQSSDIFSVGGSISVNAHGMDHQAGSVGQTLRAMKILRTDGTIETISRTENPELFHLVVGGYGLFGIILEAQLDITENVVYHSERHIIDYQEFPTRFEQHLAPDPQLGLMYGHLSTSPDSLLREMFLYTYRQVEAPAAEIPPLGEVSSTKLRRFMVNFAKQGAWPMRFKWFAEKYIEPRMEACSINRNQAMGAGEACLVSRNEPMHDSVKYLKNSMPNDTDILHEYFIPRDQFVPFIDGLRDIIQTNEANLLNASVRVVHPEDNFLNYAPSEMFSVVLYINQGTTAADNQRMQTLTRQLINLTAQVGGKFFLPYQLHYTAAQLQRAYPQIGEFFAAKKHYDPDLLLTNTFYETYVKQVSP